MPFFADTLTDIQGERGSNLVRNKFPKVNVAKGKKQTTIFQYIHEKNYFFTVSILRGNRWEKPAYLY